MSTDPNQATGFDTDAIDDLISGPAQKLGEERELGFRMIKQRMAEAYSRKLKAGRSPLMVKQSMLTAYTEALEDSFRVFTQIVDDQGMNVENIG